MVDILKRCSGSTFCCFAKRFQKGFCSVLYVYGALPQSISAVTFGRNYSSGFHRVSHLQETKRLESNRFVHIPASSVVNSDDILPSNERRTDAPDLPPSIIKRLKTLHGDIISAILEQSESTKSFINFSSLSATNFTKNMQEMAKYYFDQGGKLFRPTVSLLMSSACSQMVKTMANEDDLVDLNQYRIAIVAEMIHTASLVHDDVIDESDTRRGQPTVNARWGNRQAVLVGDFILARATKVLCSIGEPPVISTMAEIVEDLVQGELMQLTAPQDLDAVQRFQHYMTKTFYKTGSLFANSCKSVAMIAGCKEEVQKDAFEYGRHLGLAFQLVDDMLDYISSSEQLGKPSLSDLKQGLATCPVLFAAQDYPELNLLISRRFKNEGDVERALNIVMNSTGLRQTKDLAKKHSYAAAALAEKLPQNDSSRDCLVDIALSQLNRDR
uniref:Decaprenyl-diphosphate synthase subunit 1 n=1 Tax=Panagrolaimus sp. JU765 TaxID=591449 RepID=A0AC34QM64_9BILA